MLYESVRESAALFQKKMKQKQTYQQIQIFRWKFVALGLGVVLVIMIGICSELIKTLTSRKSIPINTTFLSQMLADSMILNGDFVGLEQFVHAMQNTDGVKFDKCTKVYAGFQTSGESIYKVISGKHNIVLFFSFRDLAVNKSGPSRVGIYLRTGLDKIDLNSNDKVYVTDPKDSQNSIIFNLNYRKALRLNRTQSCYISTYNNQNKQLSFLELLHLDRSSINSTLHVKIQNNECFKKGEESQKQIMNYVGELLGLSFVEGEAEKGVKLEMMEVFYLEDVGYDFGM